MLIRNGDGSWQCMGQADESTQHIKSLVSRQKSNKRKVKPKRGARPKPMQFRSNPKPFRAVRVSRHFLKINLSGPKSVK